MSSLRAFCLAVIAATGLLGAGFAEAQLIGDDFDGYATGQPPQGVWWNWGDSGTKNVDDTVFRGISGKSVNLTRTIFDGNAFAIGQSFWQVPSGAQVELTYFFRVTAVDREMMTAFGRHEGSNQVAWWVTVGGGSWNGVATFSDSQGWTHILPVAPNTWYGVQIVADISTHSYDITVWEDGNPGNTATVTGLDFRNGAAAATVDQIQFGDFHAGSTPDSDSSYLEDVFFVGPIVFLDGFESGTANAWSTVNP